MTKPLPKGWRRVRLGEFLSPSKLRFVVRDDVTYTQVTVRIRHKGIVARGYEQGSNIKTKNQNQIKSGQFLISKIDARNGACGIVPPELDDAVTTHDFLAYDVNPEIVDPGFWDIYSSLPSFVELCALASEGTTNRVRLRPDEFLDMEIPLPPLPEQKRIAGALQSVDAAIRANEEVIEKTRALKKSLASELLTRGIPGRHKRFKPINANWKIGRVVPLIDQIPESWNLARLDTVARLESGHTPSRKKPEYWENGDVPWISLQDTDALDYPEITATTERPTRLGIQNSSARLLPAGTVVFSRTATVGKCTIMGREMATSQDFANYVCGPTLNNRYLMHLFRSMKSEWKRLMAGSTHKTIYMPIFNDLQILLPPLEEQRSIADIMDGIDRTIREHIEQHQQQQELLDVLVPNLLAKGSRCAI